MLPHAAAKLSELSLTQEEIESAKKILAAADQKKLNSIKQGVKSFLAANPDSNLNKSNRYDNQFLLAFLAHQSRCSEATKRTSSKKEIASSKVKNADIYRMSVKEMDDKLGVEKATLWRSVLKGLPDLLTGRTDPQFLEYAVPQNWERMSESELATFLIEANGEATKEDISAALAFDGPDMQLAGMVSSSSGVNPVTVKAEAVESQEETDKKHLALKVAETEAKLPELVREFQDILLDMKVVQAKAASKDDPYHEAFRADLAAHCKKVKTTKDVLEKMATHEANPTQIPKLLRAIDDLRAENLQLVEFATKNGYKEEKTTNKRRKKKERLIGLRLENVMVDVLHTLDLGLTAVIVGSVMFTLACIRKRISEILVMAIGATMISWRREYANCWNGGIVVIPSVPTECLVGMAVAALVAAAWRKRLQEPPLGGLHAGAAEHPLLGDAPRGGGAAAAGAASAKAGVDFGGDLADALQRMHELLLLQPPDLQRLRVTASGVSEAPRRGVGAALTEGCHSLLQYRQPLRPVRRGLAGGLSGGAAGFASIKCQGGVRDRGFSFHPAQGCLVVMICLLFHPAQGLGRCPDALDLGRPASVAWPEAQQTPPDAPWHPSWRGSPTFGSTELLERALSLFPSQFFVPVSPSVHRAMRDVSGLDLACLSNFDAFLREAGAPPTMKGPDIQALWSKSPMHAAAARQHRPSASDRALPGLVEHGVDPDEHVRMALLLSHPFAAPPSLELDLQFAVYANASLGPRVRDQRRHRRKLLVRLAAALRPLDEFALQQRHVSIAGAPGISPVFAAVLVVLLDWPDTGLPTRLVHGFEIAAEVPASGPLTKVIYELTVEEIKAGLADPFVTRRELGGGRCPAGRGCAPRLAGTSLEVLEGTSRAMLEDKLRKWVSKAYSLGLNPPAVLPGLRDTFLQGLPHAVTCDEFDEVARRVLQDAQKGGTEVASPPSGQPPAQAAAAPAAAAAAPAPTAAETPPLPAAAPAPAPAAAAAAPAPAPAAAPASAGQVALGGPTPLEEGGPASVPLYWASAAYFDAAHLESDGVWDDGSQASRSRTLYDDGAVAVGAWTCTAGSFPVVGRGTTDGGSTSSRARGSSPTRTAPRTCSAPGTRWSCRRDGLADGT
ncbi:unnamed protein product [Prorocentrum cordatum]|uniref:Uncharacterized protein n=1 Tax=Prorocentrum cordatum TaxID=2364126 RepID=A0ABN9Y504_9DINO|nr:unnamed protein product [Polarella glacialis]